MVAADCWAPLIPGENSLPLYKDGSYELSELDLTRKFDVNAIEMLSQYKEDMVIGAIYYEGEKGWTMVKRFKIETNTLAQKFYFIPEAYLQAVFCYHPYRFQY